MAAKGSSLQNYNNELVKCIEDLREKREELNRGILRDEEEKGKIQKVSEREGGSCGPRMRSGRGVRGPTCGRRREHGCIDAHAQ
jgi:hypothetical protein